MEPALLNSIADFLADEKPRIIEEWIERIKRDPTIEHTSGMNRQELADHLPQFLDIMVAHIRASQHAEGDGKSGANAAQHGEQRWHLHFRIEELIQEISLIRKSVHRRLEQFEKNNPQARAEVVHAAKLVSEHFDHLSLTSIKQFADLQKEEQESKAAALKKLNDELTLLDSRRLRALRTVTHEMRNHLNSIQMVASVLSMDCESNVCREHLSMLHKDLEAVSLFTNDLQDFVTASSAGGNTLHVEEFEPSTLYDEVTLFVHQLANRKGLTFSSSCDPSIGTISSDRRKVHSIVMNLATNAVKYTDHGEVTLLFGPAESDDHWTIVVSDTGCGIPEDELHRIFEEFYRVASTAAQAHGSGLGLAITRELVKSLGGTITAHSTPGSGSRFVVTLPRTVGAS